LVTLAAPAAAARNTSATVHKTIRFAAWRFVRNIDG
jgi:hypothetical protein